MRKEIEFECDNRSQSDSDKCIFHDKHFVNINENRKIIVEEFFQNKIVEYFSTKSDEPLFCIGHHLFDIRFQRAEFPKSVYFNQATITCPLIISTNFMSHLSFSRAEFSGKGDVDFSGAKFLKEGIVNFSGA